MSEPWMESLRRQASRGGRAIDGGAAFTPVRDDQLLMLLDAAEALADLQTLAGGFLTAYTAASVSDEEGLLATVDSDEMRQLWHRVDEAAFDLREFFSREECSHE